LPNEREDEKGFESSFDTAHYMHSNKDQIEFYHQAFFHGKKRS